MSELIVSRENSKNVAPEVDTPNIESKPKNFKSLHT